MSDRAIVRTRVGVLAAGAARADRERRRRAPTTPFLPPVPDETGDSDPRTTGPAAVGPAPPGEPPPDARVVEPDDAPRGEPTDAPGERAEPAAEPPGDGHSTPTAGWPGFPDETLAGLRDFVVRRLTGDYDVDEFGLDRHLSRGLILPLLRTIYAGWFRVDVRGAENVPDSGPALLVSNHSGTLPWDALMTMVAVHDATPSRRLLRPLAADLVFRTPFVAELARRAGATLATAPDAERLLGAGELVGVWPEGFKGIGKLYRDRYRLQRFGRGGFVAAAIRSGAPLIPVAVVGAEEAHPMLADVEPLARLFGVPYWPVTPTWPWLGPLGLVPFPGRWVIEFGAPVPVDRPARGEDDPLVVLETTDHIRESVQRMIYALLAQRRPESAPDHPVS
jgi:1-acyl-sn-glycerol-3-phosphate acyltransferase